MHAKSTTHRSNTVVPKATEIIVRKNSNLHKQWLAVTNQLPAVGGRCGWRSVVSGRRSVVGVVGLVGIFGVVGVVGLHGAEGIVGAVDNRQSAVGGWRLVISGRLSVVGMWLTTGGWWSAVACW